MAVYAMLPDQRPAIPTRMTASLSEEVLAEALQQVSQQPEGFGHLASLGLYFEKRAAGTVELVAFADGSAAEGWRPLALMLAGAALLMLAAVLVVSILFSRWALRPVQEAWRRQQRFISDASHDLRTPLTVILANNAILLEHPSDSVGSRPDDRRHPTRRCRCSAWWRICCCSPRWTRAPPPGRPLQTAPFETVDLSTLVEGELLQLESVAFDRNVLLEDSIEQNVFVKRSNLSSRAWWPLWPTTPASTPSRPRR